MYLWVVAASGNRRSNVLDFGTGLGDRVPVFDQAFDMAADSLCDGYFYLGSGLADRDTAW